MGRTLPARALFEGHARSKEACQNGVDGCKTAGASAHFARGSCRSVSPKKTACGVTTSVWNLLSKAATSSCQPVPLRSAAYTAGGVDVLGIPGVGNRSRLMPGCVGAFLLAAVSSVPPSLQSSDVLLSRLSGAWISAALLRRCSMFLFGRIFAKGSPPDAAVQRAVPLPRVRSLFWRLF